MVRERCDLLVHLPMRGPTESLNAAVAGSIALYHIFRSQARHEEPGDRGVRGIADATYGKVAPESAEN